MKAIQAVSIAIMLNVVLNSFFAIAQFQVGSLVGRVTDEQGVALPGVTVTATSPSLQGPRVTTTDASGQFGLTGLPVGQYTVTFELEGFATVQREVEIQAGSNAIDVTMEISPVAEEIVVTGRLATISETTDVYATAAYSPEEIERLPITRNLTEAINLTPGVTDLDFDANSRSFQGVAGTFAFSYENLFLVNGVSLDENIRGEELPLFLEDAVRVETSTQRDPQLLRAVRYTGVLTTARFYEAEYSEEVFWFYQSDDTNAGHIPIVQDMAYGNPFTPDEPVVYVIDGNNDTLAVADDPSSGALRTIAKFPFADHVAGFDIAPNGSGFVAFTFPGQEFSWLYKVDLSTAATDRIGRIGGGEEGPVDFLTVIGRSDDVQCSVDTIRSFGPLIGSHGFTATVTAGGEPAPPGIPVAIEISDGPNEGLAATRMTDDQGQVKFSYQNKDGQKGDDIIIVSGSFLGQEFSCIVSQNWTDLPVITDAKVKPSLNKVTFKGFNLLGWNLEATINGQMVKFKVKRDVKAVAKKTGAAIGACDGAQVLEIFSDRFQSGDTSSWIFSCR